MYSVIYIQLYNCTAQYKVGYIYFFHCTAAQYIKLYIYVYIYTYKFLGIHTDKVIYIEKQISNT